jgi:hypothetical protein
MHENECRPRELALEINRRGFLGTGVGVSAGALAAASSLSDGPIAAAQSESKAGQAAPLPKRTLGRTGVEVSILNLGTWRSAGCDMLIRLQAMARSR